MKKLQVGDIMKIGRTRNEIKPGDYVIFNGACYQFCSGDGRPLKTKGWYSQKNLVIPKTRMKQIPFDELKKVTTGNKEKRTLLIKWRF